MTRYSPRRLGLFAEAALRLLRARAALTIRPFHKIVRGLGDFVPPEQDPVIEAQPQPADAEIARAVGRAISSAARRLPFEFLCLPRALAAQAMLRRRGIATSLYLGVRREGESVMEAHAWVDAAGIGVTGHPVPPQSRAMGRFVARPRMTATVETGA